MVNKDRLIGAGQHLKTAVVPAVSRGRNKEAQFELHVSLSEVTLTHHTYLIFVVDDITENVIGVQNASIIGHCEIEHLHILWVVLERTES